MALPKKIVKPTLPLKNQKILYGRREELLSYITKDGTYLPKSLLHDDLDRGMLDFVKNTLEMTTSGARVPVVDIIITSQNWSQFTETWNFRDLDSNVDLPFITVIRQPEVKYGSNPTIYNIPNRKQFLFAVVPTWNGNRRGADVYTIPQPIPVDITYQVKIMCNRMRELNQFNKIVMQNFASRQAYAFIKGHFIPILLDSVSDEDVMDLEKRKFYIQTYNFTMLGILIDEEEFEVKPAISRTLTLTEVGTNSLRGKRNVYPLNPDTFELPYVYSQSEISVEKVLPYRVNLSNNSLNNVSSYDVFINGNFFGSDLPNLEMNSNDVLRIEITKTNSGQESVLSWVATIV
jgi:hypothetical protein